MKKSITFVLLFILSISLIYATEVNSTDKLKDNLNVNAEKITSSMDSALHKEITISPQIESIARLIFGIKEEAITFENMIIYFTIWIGLIIVLYSFFSATPLSGNNTLIGFIFSILLVTIASTTGAIQKSSVFLISILKFLDFTRFSFIKVLFILLIILIITFFSSSLSNKIKKQIRIEKAKETGTEVGKEIAINKLFQGRFRG